MKGTAPAQPGTEQGYPPINDYALIGDTRTAALVSQQGSIDWCCLPDFDSPSVFAAVLDRFNGGRLRVGPVEEAEVQRRYIDGTPVLETRFRTRTGTLKLTDFMPMIEGAQREIEPERQIVRMLEVEDGEVEVELIFAPRPGYASGTPRLRRRGRIGWTFEWGASFHLLRTDLHVEQTVGGRLEGRTRLAAGETAYVSFSFTCRDIGVIPRLRTESEHKRDRTLDWWEGWSSRIAYDGPYADVVHRSALALRLMTFSQSGAVVAAPTSSLPESMGGARNWDYRYCWLRDAYFLLRSFLGLGLTAEADAFFNWLLHATQLTRPQLGLLYGLYGGTKLTEHILPQFEGYRRSGPVRRGNSAAEQLQLDVYGSVVVAVHGYVEKGGGPLEPSDKRALIGFGERICEIWREPDDGIWEFRGPRRHTTYSKVMCWAGLDCLLRLDEEGLIDAPAERFRTEAHLLKETILREAWSDERQAFTGAFGWDFLDASVLEMPRLKIIDACDPRMKSTFEQIEKALGHGPLLRRYEHGSDPWASQEGAFGICGFWAAEYLAQCGRVDEARARFEALLGCGNDLGLFAEEVDPETGDALGNFPQALTHCGVINAALAIDAAERAGKEAA